MTKTLSDTPETPTKDAKLTRTFAYVAVALVVTSWSSAFVFTRYLRLEFDPVSIAMWRNLIAAVILIGISLVAARWNAAVRRDPVLPRGRQWIYVVLCGIGWFFVYHVALNYGVHFIDAGTASILINIGPLFIISFAVLIYGETASRNLVVGVSMAFVGVMLIGFSSDSSTEVSWVGVALCTAAAGLYAFGALTQKPLLRHASALRVTIWTATAGSLAAVPFTVAVADYSEVSASGWWMLVYLGVIPTAVGFVAWAYAVNQIGASVAGSFTYLIPPLAIAMGWIFLGEFPAMLALIGSGVCLLGVIVAKYDPKPKREDSPVEVAKRLSIVDGRRCGWGSIAPSAADRFDGVTSSRLRQRWCILGRSTSPIWCFASPCCRCRHRSCSYLRRRLRSSRGF
ncbi:DMT family transporter [Haloglycomyces albus]|uniref:DMT family transporter n=1 Tax=Haloglycomyces albus TaxID=526067 RepID=UPI00046D0A86|nr:DMT family transporter [Haloglycomyces albus]